MNNSIILTLSLTLSIGCLPAEQKVRPEKVVSRTPTAGPKRLLAPSSSRTPNPFEPSTKELTHRVPDRTPASSELIG